MASRTAPTILSCIFARRLISVAPYFIYLITNASTVISFAIPPPSSPLSSLVCHQTIQRDYRTGRPALKSYNLLQPLIPMIVTTPQPPSLIFGNSNDSRLCLHASKTRSIDESSPTDNPKTLYEILGVPSDADRSDIKRAYVALARQTHPDAILQNKNNGEVDGTEPLESFDTIARAYQTLTTPLERKRYDRQLRADDFTNDVEQAIDDLGDKVVDLMWNVAITRKRWNRKVDKFLRRGAVTTRKARKGWDTVVGVTSNEDRKTKDIVADDYGADAGNDYNVLKAGKEGLTPGILDGKVDNIFEGDYGVETENGYSISNDNVFKDNKEEWNQADQMEFFEECREDGKADNIFEGDYYGVETENGYSISNDNVFKDGKERWNQADHMEVFEESREIEEKAKEKEQAALAMNDALSNMMMSRIRLSLKTPNAPFTSFDALRYVDGMNTTDYVTFLDRTVRLRHTTSDLIYLLYQAEETYELKEKEHRMVSEDLQMTKNKIYRTKKELEDAEKAEIWVRTAPDESMGLVSSLKKKVEECERSLLVWENIYRRTKADVGVVANEVLKTQETVRGSLLFQEKYMNEIEYGMDTIEAGMETIEDSSNKYEDMSYSSRMEQIERHLKEENDLIGNISRLEEEVSQLREKSRAMVENMTDNTLYS